MDLAPSLFKETHFSDGSPLLETPNTLGTISFHISELIPISVTPERVSTWPRIILSTNGTQFWSHQHLHPQTISSPISVQIVMSLILLRPLSTRRPGKRTPGIPLPRWRQLPTHHPATTSCQTLASITTFLTPTIACHWWKTRWDTGTGHHQAHTPMADLIILKITLFLTLVKTKTSSTLRHPSSNKNLFTVHGSQSRTKMVSGSSQLQSTINLTATNNDHAER